MNGEIIAVIMIVACCVALAEILADYMHPDEDTEWRND